MHTAPIRWESWSEVEEADRRFRRILLRLALPIAALALALPYLQLAGLEEGGGELRGKRYVELQAASEPPAAAQEEPLPLPPEPKPVQPKQEAKAVERPTPAPEVTQQQRVEQARAKAAQALAWTSQISGLTRSEVAPVLGKPLENVEPGQATDPAQAQALAAAASATSGIGEVQAVERSQSTTGLATRSTTSVKSPVGLGADRSRPGQGGDKRMAGRTLEEIQLVFDRNKGAFYALYMRALRQKPNLRGKVVLRLTIAPSGAVSEAIIVSSELRDPELERKIVQRVLLLNFGAKDVPPFTYPNYPLYFFPAG